MNCLTIDIGNHKIKTEVWNDSGLLMHTSIDSLSLKDCEEIVQKYSIEGVIVSSVRKENRDFIESLKSLPVEMVINFNQKEIDKYRHKIKYEGNIGPDRVAAYLGAVILFPKKAMLVVDAGTAITIDVVDAKENFMGGNISLGIYSRMKALSANTSMLPDFHNLSKATTFGHDTESAIESGALNGVIGELIYSYQIAQGEHNVEIIVLTGGDAYVVAQKLKEHNLTVDPGLVGRGLNYHLRKAMEA